MSKKRISRRSFLKQSGVGSAAAMALAPGLAQGSRLRTAPQADRQAVFAALGDTLIPTDPGDPGYKTLEPYKITEEVMKGLGSISDAELAEFNQSSGAWFEGQSFLELSEPERAQYLRQISDGRKFAGPAKLKTLQKVYTQTRRRVFALFYENYPENVVPRDSQGLPVLPAGDQHQVANLNTRQVVTGWDMAGFPGPLSWQEEEERRAKFRKYW